MNNLSVLKVAKELFFINQTFIQMLIKLKTSWSALKCCCHSPGFPPELSMMQCQYSLNFEEWKYRKIYCSSNCTHTHARTHNDDNTHDDFFLSYPLKNEAVLTTASFIGFNRHTGRLNELISSVLQCTSSRLPLHPLLSHPPSPSLFSSFSLSDPLKSNLNPRQPLIYFLCRIFVGDCKNAMMKFLFIFTSFYKMTFSREL